MAPHARNAVLLCCSKEEARTLHEQAQHERRTVSAYALNIVMNTVQWDEGFSFQLRKLAYVYAIRGPGPRTKVLLRCSQQEVNRIRRAAEKRSATVSGFIMQELRRSWQAKLLAKSGQQPQANSGQVTR